MESRMQKLVRERTEARRALAYERALHLLASLDREGMEAGIFGSLATGRFRLHSDIDILIRGRVVGSARALAERLIVEALRGTDIPYDLIFAEDLAKPQRESLAHDLVDASGLRQARAQAGEG